MRIRIVDAFTDKAFSGNPAGVCLLEAGDWPDDAWMRQVAGEISCETAFARPLPESADADWELRWFTSVHEANVCGHATLATAHALHTDRGGPLTVRFASGFGLLVADTRADGAVTLDFPVASLSEAVVPEGVCSALGVDVAASAYRTGALGDLLLVVGDEALVRGLRPDFAALRPVTSREEIRGVVVTAASAAGSEYDFVSRFFAPGSGVGEDPVTGSAHTALAPYWSRRLGRDSLTGLQVSARSGLVGTVVAGDRVYLTGYAVTVLDGTLQDALLR